MEIKELTTFGCKMMGAEWRRHIWTLLGLGLGVGLYVAILSMASGYVELVSLPFKELNTDLIIQRGAQQGRPQLQQGAGDIRLPFSNQPISQQEMKAIASLAEVQELKRVIMLWVQNNKNFTVVAGVQVGDQVGPARVMAWLSKGRALAGRGELVVESHYAKFHKISLDQTIHLGDRPFKVVGICKLKEGASVAAATYYIPLEDAASLAGLADSEANMLFARLHKGVAVEQLSGQLAGVMPGLLTSTTDNIGSMLKGFASISSTISSLLASVALLFAMLVSGWLVVGALNERHWQLQLLRQLGW